MFDNAGEKLEKIIKTVAYLEMVLAVLACFIWGLTFMGNGGKFVLLGLVIILVGSALAIFIIWLSNLLILSFCQLCMDVTSIRSELRNLTNEANKIGEDIVSLEKRISSGNGGNTNGSATNNYRDGSYSITTPMTESPVDYPIRKCSTCGKTIKGNQKYCMYCGNELPDAASEKTDEGSIQGNIDNTVQNSVKNTTGLWNCKKCGNKNPNSVEVCHSCGAVREL